jgi:tRNA pseudouridine55 synthase
MNPGIHLVHKAEGPTSFSLVQECLGATEIKEGRRRPRVCHGGTLDPFASGLLLILVEPATRLFDYLHAVPKVYDATVRWGIETDNGDPGGKVTFTGDSSALSEQQLDEALATFVGWHDQIPHPTSAKRIDGERAYLKAHRGETVVMPASRVYLHEAKWLGHDLPGESRLRMTVRGGYYVRALARDLGRMLGCGAHLSRLHRSAIGPLLDPGPDRNIELHGREILPWAAVRDLTEREVGELRQRRDIDLGELSPPDWLLPAGFPDAGAPVRGFHAERFCCLLSVVEGRLRLLSALWGGV